jgi:hypothetical protein
LEWKQNATYAGNAIGQNSGSTRGDIEFVRANGGNPVVTAAAQNPSGTAASPTTSGSIYWPYVVDARAALGSAAMDEFYMYYSTDHELTHSLSGIWLATGPTELGPWTGQGRVYIDNTGGLQTETGSVIWNPDENLFFMYYQQAHATGGVGDQQTCLATSPDGKTWTRVGIIMDIVAGQQPGDGHCGYFKPYRAGGQWIAYHLYGGGDYPHFAISRSADGRTWWTEPHPLSYGADQVQPRRIEWNTTDVIWWRGRFWWIGQLSDFVSGATPKDSRIAVAPLATDNRHIIGVPRTQLYPTVGAETTNYRSQSAFVGRNGQLYLYYQCGNSFYAATAKRSAV